MKNIILIGTGPMAIEYYNVVKSLNLDIVVVGRGIDSANRFENETGFKPIVGGIEKYLQNKNIDKNSHVIIATGTEKLINIIKLLTKNGIEKILVEKPAAISINELLDNEKYLKPYENSIFVAYNRRFLQSVYETEKIIKEDGGLLSMHFEFTEWAHTIEPLKKANGVKENWFFANSTHVVDLAFFIAGTPKNLKTFSKSGNLSWHEKTNFVGAGETKKGVLFSYISNWESAGRWSIELLTKKRRIYLKPMEIIQIQEKGSVKINELNIDFLIDNKFKPGIYLQVQEFIFNKSNRLPSLKEHINNTKYIYKNILN